MSTDEDDALILGRIIAGLHGKIEALASRIDTLERQVTTIVEPGDYGKIDALADRIDTLERQVTTIVDPDDYDRTIVVTNINGHSISADDVDYSTALLLARKGGCKGPFLVTKTYRGWEYYGTRRGGPYGQKLVWGNTPNQNGIPRGNPITKLPDKYVCIVRSFDFPQKLANQATHIVWNDR
jgi:hypothetical protein